ncbi:MAG: [FeFe] hydrogenase H-cluster radical SAM maturase HydG [Candidatus Omnitrophota bacterium]
MKNVRIDATRINHIIADSRSPTTAAVKAVLATARLKKGLTLEEAGLLVGVNDPRLTSELFAVAGAVKDEIYGERIVFFAPLYISDYCVNECSYCNFHASNKGFTRRRLTMEEIAQQTRLLIAMGHKRILLECGEDPGRNTIDYVAEALRTIYAVRTTQGSIRRINVNIAATSVAAYRKLKKADIGTYQLFQETYDRPTYAALHRGPKADYDRQIGAYDRAFKAGLDDLGLGVLFGLYDWRFEVLALIAHAQYLEKRFHVGPHTISVPRFRGAPTVKLKTSSTVSDRDFLKLIAILRLAVPYTGLIISTRESARIRAKAFRIGISQASAASNTAAGGYGSGGKKPQSQFEVQDERQLNEVIETIVADGFLPSFCTACYRLGRTGEAFMELSKPGEIHTYCRSNGLLTFAEYLRDFASARLRKKGDALIGKYLAKIGDPALRKKTAAALAKVRAGARDIYF